MKQNYTFSFYKKGTEQEIRTTYKSPKWYEFWKSIEKEVEVVDVFTWRRKWIQLELSESEKDLFIKEVMIKGSLISQLTYGEFNSVNVGGSPNGKEGDSDIKMVQLECGKPATPYIKTTSK